MGEFIGSVEKGGSVNTFNVTFNPHGNGTHTECLGHISPEFNKINDHLNDAHFIAELITIRPQQVGDDLIIDVEDLSFKYNGKANALIVRTTPNGPFKRKANYTESNPPYFSSNAIDKIISEGFMHLLIDLPSVDKEKDEGALASHKTFWSGKQAQSRTITELIFVPDYIEDGLYFLNLQTASFDLDCTPSRPVVYKAEAQ